MFQETDFGKIQSEGVVIKQECKKKGGRCIVSVYVKQISLLRSARLCKVQPKRMLGRKGGGDRLEGLKRKKKSKKPWVVYRRC